MSGIDVHCVPGLKLRTLSEEPRVWVAVVPALQAWAAPWLDELLAPVEVMLMLRGDVREILWWDSVESLYLTVVSCGWLFWCAD